MTRQSDMLQEMLKDGNYRLDLFKKDEIATLLDTSAIPCR